MKSGITWCPEYERILYYIQSTKTHLLPAIIFHKYIDLLKSFSQYINKYEICILTHWNFVAVAMYIHSQKKTTQSYSSGDTQLLVERGEPMHVNYTDYLKLLRWWPWNGSSISDTCIVALYAECMMLFVYMYICAWILINCLYLHSILGKHLFISLSWVALDQCLCVIIISYLMINCHFSYSKLEERYVSKHIMINWWCLLHSVLMTFKLAGLHPAGTHLVSCYSCCMRSCCLIAS